MKIIFLGAAGTVTGSRFLVESGKTRILVDCGLYQGLKVLRLRNWQEFPVEPSSLNAVVLTHAHIDHSGYLPLLYKRGFAGPIYCSVGTHDLCKILLPDAGYLQEEAARYANKRKFSKHHPALPLYTESDARGCLSLLKPIAQGKTLSLQNDLKLMLTPVGHILGATFVTLDDGRSKVVFSGDVGRPCDPIMKPPTPLGAADYIVLESTYGNRRHEREDPKLKLEEIINRTRRRGGVIIIPAFAVGRAQTVLHLIARLREERRIDNIPVYLNSPMAIDATKIFCDYTGEHRLDSVACQRMCSQVSYVQSADESKALNNKREPMIIISASGMATGGRVLHHLKAFAPDPKNTILFTGFQAAGTRGEALVNGADEIKIHGQYVPVRADIDNLNGLSAHADYVEIGDWLQTINEPPKKIFLVHGEPSAQDAMRRYLQDRFDWEISIPHYREEAQLD